MERLAVQAGVNVVAYPHPDTVHLAAELGLETTFAESCCTLVVALDSSVAKICENPPAGLLAV